MYTCRLEKTTHTCTPPKAAVLSPHGESTAAVRSWRSCCVERRLCKSWCFSWRNTSAWHLMTTDKFTVPLHVPYKLSLHRCVCHSLRALCTFMLCQASYCMIDPPRLRSSCLVIQTNTCATPPSHAARRIVFSQHINVKAALDGGSWWAQR